MQKNDRCDRVLASALLLFSLLFVFSLSRIHFETHHTGLMYRTALDVANGQMLFRDTFTKYGALTTLLHTLGILLLGRRVTSILWVSALFYAACYALFYLLARRFLPRTFSLLLTALSLLLAPFYFWDFIPWSSIFALFFTLLAAYLYVSAQKDGTHAAIGACCTLAFFCRQPVGITTLAAALFCYVLLAVRHRSAKSLLCFSLGTGVMLAAFLIPFAALGIADDFYQQSLAGMLRTAVDPSLLGASPLDALHRICYCLIAAPLSRTQYAGSAIFLLLPLCSLATLLLSLSQKSRHAERILFVSALALSAWHQYYPVPCQRHFYWGAFLSLLPLGLLLYIFARACARYKARFLAIALAALFLVPVLSRVWDGAHKIADTTRVYYENETHGDLNGLYLRPAVVHHFDTTFAAVDALRTTFPDRNVVNLTQNEFYSILGEPFYHLYASDCYYLDAKKILADYIRTHRPIVIANAPPDSSYILYHAAQGDHNDDWFYYHELPANIYVPRELFFPR